MTSVKAITRAQSFPSVHLFIYCAIYGHYFLRIPGFFSPSSLTITLTSLLSTDFSVVAWVGSVCTGLTFLTCMVASIMSDRIGIRKVAFTGGCLAFVGMLSSAFVEHLMLYYLTYGVLMGIGFAFAYAPSLVILGHYFKKRIGLVNGLVTFGSAVFTITYSLVLPLLLKEIGLKNSLLCLSGMVFMLIPYSLTWKPLIKRDSNLGALMLSTESVVEHINDCCQWTRKFLNVSIWRNRGYVVWAVANGVSLFGYFVPFVHLVSILRSGYLCVISHTTCLTRKIC